MKALALLLLLPLAGCAFAPKPLSGGRSTSTLGGDKVEIQAPENPATETKQTTKKTTVRKFAKAPASNRNSPATVANSATVEESPVQPAPQIEEETVTQEVTVEIGAAQKDTSRELAAKLQSMRPMQFLGAAFLIAALAMFHPAVRLLMGSSREMQIMVGAAGLFLIFAPQFIAGNELLIMGVTVGGLVALYVIKRSSYKSGIIDANKNGIPDDQE